MLPHKNYRDFVRGAKKPTCKNRKSSNLNKTANDWVIIKKKGGPRYLDKNRQRNADLKNSRNTKAYTTVINREITLLSFNKI